VHIVSPLLFEYAKVAHTLLRVGGRAGRGMMRTLRTYVQDFLYSIVVFLLADLKQLTAVIGHVNPLVNLS